MITSAQKHNLKVLIANSLDAAVEAAFAGSQLPDDAEELRQYALDCAEELQDYIDTLAQPNEP